MKIVIVPHTGHPIGKRADAELLFTEGPLAGLTLSGFSVWETVSGARNVIFPFQTESVNGERRSVALLRGSRKPSFLLLDAILSAYELQTRGGDADGT